MSFAASVHVLVVEDSADDFDALAETAADADCVGTVRLHLDRAPDGESALRMLGRSSQTGGTTAGRYDYVVLDLNLPGMNGLDVLRWARNRPDLRRVPIVVLSTSTNERERDACLAAGANAFHAKPTSYASYCETVREMLGYWGRHSSTPAHWTLGRGTAW